MIVHEQRISSGGCSLNRWRCIAPEIMVTAVWVLRAEIRNCALVDVCNGLVLSLLGVFKQLDTAVLILSCVCADEIRIGRHCSRLGTCSLLTNLQILLGSLLLHYLLVVHFSQIERWKWYFGWAHRGWNIIRAFVLAVVPCWRYWSLVDVIRIGQVAFSIHFLSFSCWLSCFIDFLILFFNFSEWMNFS